MTKNSKFLVWANENYGGLKDLGAHEFMCEGWAKRLLLFDANRRVKEVKNILANNDPLNRSGLEGILQLDRLDFFAWSYFPTSIRRKNRNGGESYLKNYRNFKSALRLLFCSVGVTLPPWFDTHAKELVTALRRVYAQELGEDAESRMKWETALFHFLSVLQLRMTFFVMDCGVHTSFMCTRGISRQGRLQLVLYGYHTLLGTMIA